MAKEKWRQDLEDKANKKATEDWHKGQMDYFRKKSNEMSRRGSPKSEKGCFIATAAYGGYNAPEVRFLSTFRDELLSQRAWGREFIRFYYLISPPLAGVIAKSYFLRLLARKLFLQPVIELLRQVWK